jgi:hypothetical protein
MLGQKNATEQEGRAVEEEASRQVEVFESILMPSRRRARERRRRRGRQSRQRRRRGATLLVTTAAANSDIGGDRGDILFQNGEQPPPGSGKGL